MLRAVDGWKRPEPLKSIAGPAALPSELTPAQERELARCEVTIEKGWETFVEVGNALTVIRDEKLYQNKHKNFEHYCRERWGYAQSHTYRLINAAGVVKDISPIGEKVLKGMNEAQIRELVPVPPEQRMEALKKSIAAAGTNPVTAKVVREVVMAEYLSKARPKPVKTVKANSKLKPAIDLIVSAEHAVKAKHLAAALKILNELRKYLESGAFGS